MNMGKETPEMQNLAPQLYGHNKKMLDLFTENRSGSGFEKAVRRLFGDAPGQEKPIRIGTIEVIYSELGNNRLSFLPGRWKEELDKTKGTWAGCANWWAGYPFIAWVEARPSDDGNTGYLKLNAEVGPISDHTTRRGIIQAIQLAASARRMERIQFPDGASDKQCLYSRFLRKNSVAVEISDTSEVQNRILQLVASYEPEFELVASVIPQFSHFTS
jgi:hypothetical protein